MDLAVNLPVKLIYSIMIRLNMLSFRDGETPLKRMIHLFRRCTMDDTIHPHGLFQQELSFDEPTSSLPQRRCTGPCGRTLDATPEYFHRNKKEKSGLRSVCKECRAQQSAEHQSKSEVKAQQKAYRNRPEVQARQKEYRLRPGAKERKEEQRNRPEVKARTKEQRKEYRERPEVKEHLKEYREEYLNRPGVKEHRKEFAQEYASRPEVKERRRTPEAKAKHKAYYARIRERKLKYNKERYNDAEVRSRVQEYHKRYYSRPEVKERYKEYYSRPEVKERLRRYDRERYSIPEVKWRVLNKCHNRRALKRSIAGNYTPQQIQEQLKRQKGKCYYAACGHAKFKKVKGQYQYHIEHTFPISRVAGTDILANSIDYLVLACPHCNRSKHNKFPWEWPEGGRLL